MIKELQLANDIYLYENLSKMTKKEYQEMFDALPLNIRQKATKMASNIDKNITIFEYFTLKKKLNTDDLDKLKYTSRGKPFIDGCKQFSISHSNDTLCIAINDTEIGIDIEQILNYDELIAKQICNVNELSQIQNSNDKNLEFTKLWVKKESLIKCKAEGFNQDLKKILLTNTNYKFEYYYHKTYVICKCTKENISR